MYSKYSRFTNPLKTVGHTQAVSTRAGRVGGDRGMMPPVRECAVCIGFEVGDLHVSYHWPCLFLLKDVHLSNVNISCKVLPLEAHQLHFLSQPMMVLSSLNFPKWRCSEMMQEKVPVAHCVIAACHPTSALLGFFGGGVATPCLGLPGAPLDVIQLCTTWKYSTMGGGS